VVACMLGMPKSLGPTLMMMIIIIIIVIIIIIDLKRLPRLKASKVNPAIKIESDPTQL
jgi:hypothetical protein